MINTILFDLDGTLLPIDAKAFEKIYFGGLSSHFTDMYAPQEFIKLIWDATIAMVKDTTQKTNEVVFMEALGSVVNDKLEEMQRRFKIFYDSDFDKLKAACIESAEVKEAVSLLKQKGYTLVIATNPMFPKIAIEKRIGWTGLNRNDFSYVTSFENNHYCKPQPKFFEEILSEIHKAAQECMMVGNDAQEDMIAKVLGIETYLITTHLVAREDKPDLADHQGSYADFLLFVQNLPSLN
jgi:FMN phosphatase YigB (HAD superfamily)